MKKSPLLLLILLLPFVSWAQTAPFQKPAFLQMPYIPGFNITLPDGSTFTNNNLKKNVPTLFFLFSVDCDHCKHATEELLKQIHRFKGTQIIMVTPFSVPEMTKYYLDYHIQRYPLITMGSNTDRKLFYFFYLRYFPGLYVYDKNQKLVFNFEGTAKIDTLLHYLKPEKF